MTPEIIISAFGLPMAARVDKRVPKKLLLESAAPSATDKRLINERIDGIQWLAALKPTTCGVPASVEQGQGYLEIAVIQLTLRTSAKQTRLVELVHRAIPYPVVLIAQQAEALSLSLAHKRQALNEPDKVVLDGEVVTAPLQVASANAVEAFLLAMDLTRQPRTSLFLLYQGWMDTLVALQASAISGTFQPLDSAEGAANRRVALHACIALQERIAALRSAASKASQIARQVELNIELRRLQDELVVARSRL